MLSDGGKNGWNEWVEGMGGRNGQKERVKDMGERNGWKECGQSQKIFKFRLCQQTKH